MEAYGAARQYGLVPPSVEQPQYNLFCRDKLEADFLDPFDRYGIGTTIWSPLASGILTGKYNDGIPDDSRMNLEGYEWLRDLVESDDGKRKIAKARELQKIADELGVSLAKLSIAWCLKNPNVSTVILGASRSSQLEENLGALDVVPMLTAEIMERIETIVQNKPRLPKDFL
jgi:aryl-alcohol dehydrogenase-like predicted oxidoreductase